MKTNKYTIQFSCYERDMSTEIEISKKEFNNQFKLLEKQIADNNNHEESFGIERLENKIYDRGKYTVTYYFFTCGCTDTVLAHYECKEGYKFK